MANYSCSKLELTWTSQLFSTFLSMSVHHTKMSHWLYSHGNKGVLLLSLLEIVYVHWARLAQDLSKSKYEQDLHQMQVGKHQPWAILIQIFTYTGTYTVEFHYSNSRYNNNSYYSNTSWQDTFISVRIKWLTHFCVVNWHRQKHFEKKLTFLHQF